MILNTNFRCRGNGSGLRAGPAAERCRNTHSDAMVQRVYMAMVQLPYFASAPIDLRHPMAQSCAGSPPTATRVRSIVANTAVCGGPVDYRQSLQTCREKTFLVRFKSVVARSIPAPEA